RWIVALEEELVRPGIGERVEEDRARRLTVAASSTDLLVVALDRRRKRRVDDGSHIGLVDAHAEGGRRDDDVELAREESRLDGLARASVHARVIGGCA